MNVWVEMTVITLYFVWRHLAFFLKRNFISGMIVKWKDYAYPTFHFFSSLYICFNLYWIFTRYQSVQNSKSMQNFALDMENCSLILGKLPSLCSSRIVSRSERASKVWDADLKPVVNWRGSLAAPFTHHEALHVATKRLDSKFQTELFLSLVKNKRLVWLSEPLEVL